MQIDAGVITAATASAITAVIGAGTLAGLILKPIRRLVRQNDDFHRDWYGEAARPGHDAIPGVPERLRRIEKELRPNGGSTLRDAIARQERRLTSVEEHISRLSS